MPSAARKRPENPFDAKQADAILELQLHRLTRLSIDEILNELKEIREKIGEYESILGSDKKLRGVIVKELEEIRKNYGDERRTQILDEAVELQLEDLIADEQMAVTVSHSGYLKRTPIATYRSQRRGGSGRIGMRTREEDFVERLIIASTHAYLLVFTNTGRVYWLKVYEIPDVGSAGKGKAINQLVALQPGESVRTILNVRDLDDETKYVFFATRNGTVKKTPLKDFSNVMSRGIIAIGIEKDDELVGAKLTDGQEIVFLASHDGMAIRFDEADVRPMGRPAYGVRGMDLDDTDYVVGMAITPKGGVSAEKLVKGHDLSRAEETAPTEGALAPEAAQARLQPDSLRHRERLRQAHSGGGIPPAVARRQGRHQRQDHVAQRQSRGHPAGERGHGSHGHQPVRQDHPSRHLGDPRGRPLHPGRPPAGDGRRRQGGRRRRHPARGAEREWNADSLGLYQGAREFGFGP